MNNFQNWMKSNDFSNELRNEDKPKLEFKKIEFDCVQTQC